MNDIDEDASFGARVDDEFVRRFHAGERATLERCYRAGFDVVDRAVARVLEGADRETVVHEVFARLLDDERARANFTGGSLRAWLATVARNRAIDFARRRRREELVLPEEVAAWRAESDIERRAIARARVDRFRAECLPEKWRAVFEACFVRQLSQREAAAELGISRTTLAYRATRVRALLRRFFLEEHS